MDFEWKKLINGESEIDADDINALADGITKNEKKIKAIKDIMDNGGTIPEYLTDFFKDRPQDLSVDDLDDLTYENTGGGVFLWGKPQDGTKQNDIVFVTQGFSPRRREFLVTFQMRISLSSAYLEPNGYNIKQRYQTFSRPSLQEPDGWSEWENIYPTFKKVPYGKSINDLVDVDKYGGAYWLGEDDNLSGRIEILNVSLGWYWTEEYGDLATTYQILAMQDGWGFTIRQRYVGFDDKWTDWEDVFATPQYVKEQIAKIPTGGGSEWTKIGKVTMGGTFEKISSYANGVITFENFVPDTNMNYVISNADGTKNLVFCRFVKTDNEGEYTLKNLDGGVISPTIDITTNFVQNLEANSLSIINHTSYNAYKVRVTTPLFLAHGLRATYMFGGVNGFDPSVSLHSQTWGTANGYKTIYEAYSYSTANGQTWVNKEITSAKPYSNGEVAISTTDMSTVKKLSMRHNSGLLTIGTLFELWGAK